MHREFNLFYIIAYICTAYINYIFMFEYRKLVALFYYTIIHIYLASKKINLNFKWIVKLTMFFFLLSKSAVAAEQGGDFYKNLNAFNPLPVRSTEEKSSRRLVCLKIFKIILE